ncbi:VOC family protein [Mucilaginibacter sp. UR6-11]|uniref:VOC family protein n=1 Tax=Mucilaginibacter sp. UR6-11 TaxID=1435644 RepID=UPI001E36C19B|nr:VOC family protein [Mucilaginibacter sp. UR6-11]MCC8426631.1 VOC family protein [Mucilaginibacter sp. UR6-11]
MSNLVFISPFFIVADLQASVNFYVHKLGFEVQYIGPEEESYFAMVGRGPVSLMLKSSGQPLPNHTRYDWARRDAFISVTDPDALSEEFSASGVTFNEPLGVDTDNLRGFSVVDPNGYVLFFGKPDK